MPPDKFEGARQAPGTHAMVPSKLDRRFQPELRLPVRVMDVDVRPRPLTREKTVGLTLLCYTDLGRPELRVAF